MISRTSHFVLLRILSLLLLLVLTITTCDAGCLWKPTRLHITNELCPGLDLTIHCKSRNDDLGQHVVPFGGEYTIDFCPNFWGTTLFFCGMSWSGEVHWFDIYDASRDSSRCGNCSWTVEATGPCMDYYNYYTKEFVCYPGNDKASLQ
ncbi:self-incompatibility family protein [Salix suchowensis]|nr:self-incompatibility family protein [Salix suchowensis]